MQFKRFRISGFKSFAEPVTLDIYPGLTGIVGPNGCGKSNLVESLRWVMGEASFKSMRGGSMEDVIFAGTALRPSREIAEVSVVLDNQDHSAPAPYTDKEEIEVARHIQREVGSHYQINGEEMRARDVNMFFADLIGGAHSSALVSQGRVEQIILAKPKERRRILEEAAGITGLHARRHEAELKLNRAQENLNKTSDVIRQTEQRLRQLKKQATQAERYRKISDEMKRTEALRLYLRWRDTEQQLTVQQTETSQIGDTVDETVRNCDQARATEQAAENLWGERRRQANEAASAYERLEGERALYASEAKQMEEKIATLKRSQQELVEDIARAQQMHQESEKQLAVLEEEAQTINASATLNDQTIKQAKQKTEAAQTALDEADHKTQQATKKNAEWSGQMLALERKFEETKTRLAQTTQEQEDITQQLEAFSAFDDDNQEVSRLKQSSDEAYQAARDAEVARQQCEKTRAAAEQAERDALHQLSEARNVASKHQTEVAAMGKLFADIGAHPGKAVIDLIKGSWFGTRNLDRAMAAALGDDLMAALEEGSASFWKPIGKAERHGIFFRRNTQDSPAALPAGAMPLSKYIRKPPVLHKRLAQTGLIDAALGAAAQKKLKPGQRLVSREGHLWRWDGYYADPRIAQATQNRLAQWRTFSALEAEAQKARAAQDAAQTALERTREALIAASEALENTKHQQIKANENTERWRDQWQQAAAEISTAQARKATLDEAARRLADETIHAQQAMAETSATLEEMRNNHAPKEEEETTRAAALNMRDQLSEAKEAQALIAQNISKRRGRAQQIEESRLAYEKNRAQQMEQMRVLSQRTKNTDEELAASAARPSEIHQKISAMDKKLAAAHQDRDHTQKLYAQAETEYQRTRQQTKDSETNLHQGRENLVRQKAICENLVQTLAERAQEIESKYQRAPAEIPAWAELSQDSAAPEISAIEAMLAQLEEERNRIGAPNLQAETEREEIIEQHEQMKTEAADLDKAIQQLRRAIATLNREGRDRLTKAFEQVNTHFKQLFKTLFGGGQARLTLFGEEDVLEAGLDIIAQPPGKSVQNMSLLSGGEKTLTAIALLFAAFKTRPTPICVLDEVDAPLDDKNVERFCDLLADIASSGQTRFLIVTHHALTLSRMDRLYGVTMEEEGVSRIVSVELAEAETLREQPMSAAE